VPLSAEDIELSPAAARASLAERQEALARESAITMLSKSHSEHVNNGADKV
jgi:hypothetical protein